ncbi:MAG: alpha/beta hydrolase [Sutterellaceae bacterium]|nr:alpha/beta hydrolase [Sutterellaceae bacterium]
MTIKKLVLGSVAALTVAGSAMAATPAEDAKLMGYSQGAQVADVSVSDGRIDAISGIVYRQIISQRAVRPLHMTIFVPRTSAKKPAVLYFPGGGFTSADHEKFLEMRYALAREGFVVAAFEYRAVPTKFPGLVEDAKAAVRYIKANAAQFGVDPDRIGVLGDSAGGYVVQMLGTTNGEKGWDNGDNLNVNSDVNAVVSIYGISDVTKIGEGLNQEAIHSSPAVTEALLVNGPAFGSFPGAPITADPAKARHASPMGHVDGTEPPFLIMHGSADKLVSPLQSKDIYEALKAKKVDVDYVLVRGAQHGDLPWYQPAVISRVVNFFRTKLGTPEQAGEGKGNNL